MTNSEQSVPITASVEAHYADELRDQHVSSRNYWLHEAAKHALYEVVGEFTKSHRDADLAAARIEITFEDLTATATLALPDA